MISAAKHGKKYDRKSLENHREASSAEMSKKLNDRANFKQESYKEKSTLQNQDFENLLEETLSNVFIIVNKCY